MNKQIRVRQRQYSYLTLPKQRALARHWNGKVISNGLWEQK